MNKEDLEKSIENLIAKVPEKITHKDIGKLINFYQNRDIEKITDELVNSKEFLEFYKTDNNYSEELKNERN